MDKIREAFEVKTWPGGFKYLAQHGKSSEAMLSFSGYLMDFRLPPLPQHYQINRKNPDTLNYFVTLFNPLASDYSKAMLNAITLIFDYFDEGFAEGDLNAFNHYELMKDVCAIRPATRLCTPIERSGTFQEVPVPTGIDEHGFLQQILSGSTYIHTDDNVITFHELVPDTEQRLPVKQEAFPGCFRVGQLVETTMTFRTVKVGKKHVPLLHLDRVLLVSRRGTEWLNNRVTQLRCALTSNSFQIVCKRQIDQISEDEDFPTTPAKRPKQSKAISDGDNEKEMEEETCAMSISEA
ncbi:hypothetical protein C0992_003797 [Termitomyces sp. T32_za158]|nr:hypothetical protein C0992_003797 [Termitomyces sp. T32_za158]